MFSVQQEGYVAILALHRPPANALASSVLKELSERLDALKEDEQVRVIVLHGEGRFFQLVPILKSLQRLKRANKQRNLLVPVNK